MAERYRRRSALAHLGLEARASDTAGEAGVMLGESPIRGLLVLRGDGASAGFRSAVAGVLGLEPVVEPSTAARRRDVSMLWLGPDEWLVVAPDRRVERIERTLRDALEGQHAALTDVSHSRTVLALSGPDARAVLAKGCPLDLHPRAFGPGRCAQTLFAGTGVSLLQRDESPRFEMMVRRSYARWLWRWMEVSAEMVAVE